MDISINKHASKIDAALGEDIKWARVIIYFMLHGIFVLFMAKRDDILHLSAEHLFSLIATVVIVGFFIGVISNFFMGLLVALVGKAFNANISLKKIYKAFAFAYRPYILATLLIMAHITISYYFESNFIQENAALIVILMAVIKFTIGIIALWSIFLLIKGLMVAQGLPIGKAIINYLIAALVFAPLCYLLLMKI